MKKHLSGGSKKTICGQGKYGFQSLSIVNCQKCLKKVGVSPSGGLLLPFKCPFCTKKLTLTDIIEKESSMDLRCDYCGKAMLVGCFTDKQIAFVKYYISITKAIMNKDLVVITKR